jgi:hypothetical protein
LPASVLNLRKTSGYNSMQKGRIMSALHLNLSDETFRRLHQQALKLNVSVEELIMPWLDKVAMEGTIPLTGAAWQRQLQAWKDRALAREGRYPEGFQVDDSRESIYREREDAQL